MMQHYSSQHFFQHCQKARKTFVSPDRFKVYPKWICNAFTLPGRRIGWIPHVGCSSPVGDHFEFSVAILVAFSKLTLHFVEQSLLILPPTIVQISAAANKRPAFLICAHFCVCFGMNDERFLLTIQHISL
jgi:hypothetical protein